VITIVVMGVAGTGKTTVGRGLADRLGWPFEEGDELHPPANVEKMRSGVPLDDEDRWPWLHRVADWIGDCERNGLNGVVTCSALKRSYRDLLRYGHPSVRFCHLTAPRDLLSARLAARGSHFMPESLLDSQLRALEALGDDEPGGEVGHPAAPQDVLTAAVRVLGLDPPADGMTREVLS
jgi:gluconokinase